MELFPILTGYFRLDGGAMFGVVPKTIWQKTNPPDDRNRIRLAMRALLIRAGERYLLIDNGLGHKYDNRFADLYAVEHHPHHLLHALQQLDITPEQITDLILTHLHFDHAGGTTYMQNDKPTLTFPHATIWLQKSQFELALNPNAREAASFFPQNIEPIRTDAQLKLLEGPAQILPGIDLLVFNGHTQAMQLPLISYKNYKILYAADLFPTFGHIPLPYVMGYDVRPLVTLDERQGILNELADSAGKFILFYEHDPDNECGTVMRTAKGGFAGAAVFPLSQLN
jgi:glyoxylase-like metal-dependent hydrolase (beta-lactamase superfamily II)